ncbi:tRNA (adenosine(37)-N6)-threonylcarbamoyltransferase complex ATPase subunit type 1 TsaE [Aeromicrobium massiliense]|uniref:tRNA (adenosine(37)-N6)-threonylcarbamoyltransferase complex ATPase subunit type 1 TsaE n=1 Tax=Aeromicrobium massiliense TaxID=1464554 RepID=UPI00031BDE7A|nr:tRNA (adenosine(37)-N6)-threonylcarbamoyltransferase complex ATPase subunit type 1 TsaE [Aeromicrobium massiliense]
MTGALDVVEARPEHAEAMADVIRRSFGARPVLDPPSSATDETAESVRASIETSGGLLALRRGRPVGALLYDETRPGLLGLRRVSVDPDVQARGIASALVGVAEDTAEERGKDGVWIHVREELPATVRFWRQRRYETVGQEGPLLVLGKTLWLSRELPDAESTQRFAGTLAGLLQAGDVLVMTGGLGAGKTTFTQGLGEALGVRGPITSPTFVIARHHPSLVGGPALVHVDAYRLEGALELDDLDLDTSVEEAVTVVEWGEGMAEHLADSWLEVRLERRLPREDDPLGTAVEHDGGDDTRVVTVRPHGPRWVGVPLRSTLLA